jgi:lipoprotein-releasing system ATP-binding protein
MSTAIILKASGVSKYYNLPKPIKALNNINLQISKGQIVNILGKPSSGKSTLLHCLSTLDNNYDGSLEILNKTIKNTTPNNLALFRNEHIGLVFSKAYLLPTFNCIKNVMLPALKLNNYTYDYVEHLAYKNLELLALRKYALLPIGNLNPALQQRVAIARALINKPTILMYDEPTKNLDPKNATIIFDIIQQLAALNYTSIITTNINLQNTITANTELYLNNGTIVN